MFDLTFQPSVLDKMPVGTSFRDSGHEIVKTNGGWKCEECYSSTPEPSSSAYMSTFSQGCALEKFAGAEIDPDDLDPRLLAFLPAGTRVADNDTPSDNRLCWHKTKTGRWIWTDRKPVLISDDDGISVENLSSSEDLRPFRLLSVGTDDAPESDGAPTEPVRLTVAEATSLRDIVYDNGGRKWIYTSEGGYRLALGGGVLGRLREQLPADYVPYFTEDPRAESAPETEPEIEKTPEGKPGFAASEATNLKDCRFRDRHGDVWVFDEDIERWRFILEDGSLSSYVQHESLETTIEPFTLVEGEIETETESEPEPEPEIELTAEEASPRKDTVFKDSDGDAWFFDFSLWQWRAMGPGWAFAKEELDSIYSPYTKVGPLSEFVRVWTAEEASNFKDAALEDNDGDIWIYDVPSERWKCTADGAPDGSELKKVYQPYRIKRDGATVRLTAAPGSAIFLGYDEPYLLAGGTEEVTLEGSAKEAVELLDRIARSLESIDRKLGDK